MSEEPQNLVGVDSLNNYLKGSQSDSPPTFSSPTSSPAPFTDVKTSANLLEEMNSKIKMLEAGGNILEKLFINGERIVDKVIKAKKMQWLAENGGTTPAPARDGARHFDSPPEQLNSPAPAPAQAPAKVEDIYEGFISILEFFLSVDNDLKVVDLLKECTEKKELALQMIGNYMDKKPQVKTPAPAQAPAEPMAVKKKEERLKKVASK